MILGELGVGTYTHVGSLGRVARGKQDGLQYCCYYVVIVIIIC